MHKNESRVTYYLFNKDTSEKVRVFHNMFELREFIEWRMYSALKDMALNTKKPSDWQDIAPINLSMNMECEYKTVENYYWDYDPVRQSMIRVISGTKQEPVNYEVIIDSEGHIFNYTELVNEIIAKKFGWKIHYGEGYTYTGNPNIKPKPCNRHYCLSGARFHSKGSGSYRKIVSKRELINTYDIPRELYMDVMCDDEPYSVDVKMVRRAMKSIKTSRIALFDEYTSECYKYGNPSSWKNQKKRKQWEHRPNNQRQCSKKDYIKKQIDAEYAYDYEDYFD